MTTMDKIGRTIAHDAEDTDIDVLSRTGVTIPAEDWEAFEAWINRPAEIIPALQALAAVIPPWRR